MDAVRPAPRSGLQRFESLLEREEPARYVFRLFVAGSTPRSLLAIMNLRDLCARYVDGSVDLRVIDVYQQPDLARASGILAVPTLVMNEPGPVRRVVGDLSNTDGVLAGLKLQTLKPKSPSSNNKTRETTARKSGAEKIAKR